jgi:hypothetical protein
MAEWWSYSLSSFLLFSPKTYYRLFELYNRQFWPAQIAALILGVVLVACLPAKASWRGRLAAAVLSAAWAWIAWAYLAERYATINWAAGFFALGFALEAVLLIWIGLIRNEFAYSGEAGTLRAAGISMAAFALLLQPLLGPMLGRPWTQVEIFGFAPDPTVVATLGTITAMRRPHWMLLIVPLAWCLIGGATLWAMQSKDAFLIPSMTLLALVLALRKSRLPSGA